jgi:lactose/L-arabinose transport system permease protein
MKKHMGKLGRVTMNKRKGLNMEQKRNLTGWAFLLPASILIFVFCFYPMVQALILSFQKGTGSAVQPAGFANYARILKDATFQQCLFNTIFYFVIQVPIMLILALILAQLLNSPDIKGKGIYRTMIFLPCATSLVSYSMIFKSLFANDGLVNRVLSTVGIPTVDWFQNAWAARWVIVIALIWRWTGYNMVFYLAGLQNIDYSIYEAARIDGANPVQMFFRIKLPYLLSVQGPSLVTDFVKNVNNFNVIYLLTQDVFVTNNQQLAQSNAKEIDLLVTWLFRLTQEYYNYKMAAVLGIMVFIVCAVFTVVCFHFINKKEATFS